MKKVWVFILSFLLVCSASFLNVHNVQASTDEEMQEEEMDTMEQADEEGSPEEMSGEETPDEELSDEGDEPSEEEEYMTDPEEGRS